MGSGFEGTQGYFPVSVFADGPSKPFQQKAVC